MLSSGHLGTYPACSPSLASSRPLCQSAPPQGQVTRGWPPVTWHGFLCGSAGQVIEMPEQIVGALNLCTTHMNGQPQAVDSGAPPTDLVLLWGPPDERHWVEGGASGDLPVRPPLPPTQGRLFTGTEPLPLHQGRLCGPCQRRVLQEGAGYEGCSLARATPQRTANCVA